MRSAYIIRDNESKKSKGFAFIDYYDKHGVEKALQARFINIDGKLVRIRKFEPKDQSLSTKDSQDSVGKSNSPLYQKASCDHGPEKQLFRPDDKRQHNLSEDQPRSDQKRSCFLIRKLIKRSSLLDEDPANYRMNLLNAFTC